MNIKDAEQMRRLFSKTMDKRISDAQMENVIEAARPIIVMSQEEIISNLKAVLKFVETVELLASEFVEKAFSFYSPERKQALVSLMTPLLINTRGTFFAAVSDEGFLSAADALIGEITGGKNE